MIIDLNSIEDNEIPSLPSGKYEFEIVSLKEKPLRNPQHGNKLELEVKVIAGEYLNTKAFFSFDCFNTESEITTKNALVQLKRLGRSIGVLKLNIGDGCKEIIGKQFIGLVEIGDFDSSIKEFFVKQGDNDEQ